MGCAAPFPDDLPFEEKVKCLADEELIEIWAESQQIESMLNAGLPPGCFISQSYEDAIINELAGRAARKMLNNDSLPGA